MSKLRDPIRLDLFDPVYKSAVTFVVDKDFERFKDWLKDDLKYTEHETLYANASGYCIGIDPENSNHTGGCYIIWLRTKELGTLLHEITHVAMHIFDEKGIPIRVENTEAFAYYVEHWFNRVRKAW